MSRPIFHISCGIYCIYLCFGDRTIRVFTNATMRNERTHMLIRSELTVFKDIDNGIYALTEELPMLVHDFDIPVYLYRES